MAGNPIAFEHFGGLVTLVDRTDLGEPGASPDCRNVAFYPGRVQKRPGLTSVFSALSGTPNVNGISQGVDRGNNLRSFLFGSDGSLYEETTPGTLTSRCPAAGLPASALMRSVTAYGRQYFGFSDGEWPLCPNFFIDDSVLMQIGPTPYLVPVGYPRIAHGPYLAELSTGNVTAGVHKVVIIPVGKDGSRGAPSLSSSISASGGKQISVQGASASPTDYWTIPEWLGSWQIAMTAAGGETYYIVGTYANIVSSAVIVDISDAVLMAGELVDSEWNIMVPPDSAAVFGPFSGRLALLGCSNMVDDGNNDLALQNRLFLWGNTVTVFQGWTITGSVSNPALLSEPFPSARSGLVPAIYGASGLMNSTSGFDVRYNLPVSNGQYKLKVRACKNSKLSAGDIKLTVGDGSYALKDVFTIPYASLTTGLQTFEITADGGTTYLTRDGSAALQMKFECPAWAESSSHGLAMIDSIGFVDATTPHAEDQILWARPGFANEFDNVHSYQQIGFGSGERVTTVFEIAGTKYATKERSLYLITDNTGEADTWTSVKIADGVGTPSFNGVGMGEDFVVIAGREGVYLFQGSGITDQNIITREIRPTWESINWEYGHKIFCVIDREEKRIFIGVPLGAATSPTTLLVCDYTEGWNDPLVEGGLIVTKGRKWTFWDISANSASVIERQDGSRQIWLGNNTGTGKIYKLDDSVYSDDGAAIVSYYEATPVGISPGVNLCEKLLVDLHGTGTVAISHLDYYGTETVIAYAPTLIEPSPGLLQVLTHRLSEKVSIKIANNSADGMWTLCRMVQFMKPWRGIAGKPLNV